MPMDEESQIQQASSDARHTIPRKPVPSSTVTSIQPDTRSPSGYTSVAQEDDGLTVDKEVHHRAGRWKFAWTSECLCLIFAFANLAALIIVLRLRRDKPLPKWPSLLGINTLVSIFSSLTKVGLMFCVAECLGELKWIWFEQPHALTDFDHFDSASRGPWGALKLIIRRPMNVLSTLGAVITIIAIAIDPFTQQVLKFYSCPRPDGGQTAFIPRSNNYSIGMPDDTPGGAMLDPKMTGALYQGLLNPFPNATASVSVICPSGNCTFATVDDIAYSSLAICSSVKDISNTVTGNGSLGPATDINGDWSYTLPSGLNITRPYALRTAIYLPDTHHVDPKSVFQFEILATTTNCSDGYNYSHVAGLNALAHCALFPFAAYVTLTPCVLSYGQVKVANGMFEETVRDSTPLDYSGSGYYSIGNVSSVAGVDCAGSLNPQGPKTMMTALKSITGMSGPVRSADANAIHKTPKRFWDIMYYDPACVFSLGYGPTSGLGKTLTLMFGWKDNPQSVWLSNGMWQPGTGDDWTKVFWNTGGRVNVSSVSKVVDGLTTSINSIFRTQGDPSNSEPVRGVVMVNQTCVGIDWPWLALPVILCAWTVSLLILTMVQCRVHNRRRGVYGSRSPWKTSSLPLFWCGLADLVKDQHGRLDGLDQMRLVSDRLTVSLHTDDQLDSTEEMKMSDSPISQRWVLKSAELKTPLCTIQKSTSGDND